MSYDAILFVSFGGPEGPDDVLPFLENVLRGRNVPRERMLEVAEHYQQFGGISPINGQNRELIDALRHEFETQDLDLPIYWGNRNWHPMLVDTLKKMRDDGIQRALAFVTSAFSSYSGCRQYREDIQKAQTEIGPGAPVIDKLRMFFNHPGFVETMRDRTNDALQEIPLAQRDAARLVYTAHSIPLSMSDNCRYVEQLRESARLVTEAVGHQEFDLVYQSRSGPPHQPWLEPDICDHLETLASNGCQNVVIIPLGFVSDHMEVKFDLDTEAQDEAKRLEINVVRAGTAGTHPRFVSMICELVVERLEDTSERPALGVLGPNHDVCPEDCCLPGRTGPPSGRPSTSPGR